MAPRARWPAPLAPSRGGPRSRPARRSTRKGGRPSRRAGLSRPPIPREKDQAAPPGGGLAQGAGEALHRVRAAHEGVVRGARSRRPEPRRRRRRRLAGLVFPDFAREAVTPAPDGLEGVVRVAALLEDLAGAADRPGDPGVAHVL